MRHAKRRRLPRAVSAAFWGLVILISLYVILRFVSPGFRSFLVPVRLEEKRNLLPRGEVVDHIDGGYLNPCDSVTVELDGELYVYVSYSSFKSTESPKKYYDAILNESSAGSWGCKTLYWHTPRSDGQSGSDTRRSYYVRCEDPAAVQGRAALTLMRDGREITLTANAERLNGSFFKMTFTLRGGTDRVLDTGLTLNCFNEDGVLLHKHDIHLTEETEETQNGT